ncbi:hypothetical protein OG216_42815 [Streptomycetaceae bacterium NBC_01309]
MELPLLSAETRLSVLRGLALNPAAPVSVLLRLLRTPWAAYKIAMFRDQIPVELALAILDLNDGLAAAALAGKRHVPFAVRRRLAGHTCADVRAATVREQLWDLSEPERGEMAVLTASLASDSDVRVRSEVARNDHTPDEIHARLAADEAVDVRIAAAGRWKLCPPVTHRALLTDPESAVRTAELLWRAAPPVDLHHALLADPATRVLTVPHVRLTGVLAVELARDPDERVRAAVARNATLPRGLRRELEAERNHAVRYAVLTSPHTESATRTRLYQEVCAGSEDDEVWHRTARRTSRAWLSPALNWLRDSSVADRLAALDSPLAFLRCAVAQNTTGLPDEAVARMLNDSDPDVQKEAAFHSKSVPPEDLERIVWEHGDVEKTRHGILARPDFPSAAHPRFATSERYQLRAAAAAGDLPGDVLEVLATTDPHGLVRGAAAANPRLPVHCLPRLLADEESLGVAWRVGQSPNLPVEWMELLLSAEGIA